MWLVFPRWSIWGVTCLGILSKWTFSHLSHWELPEMCVETLRKGLHFYEMVNLRGHMPRFTLKNECFPIYLLGNIINVCWNPQNRARFSETIDLRGHMPRFILKMNVSPSISLETPINACWNHQNRGCFSETIDLRGHMLRFTLKMNMFPHLSPWELHYKCLLKPSEQGSVLLRWSIWGVTCLSLLWKLNVFPSISLEIP